MLQGIQDDYQGSWLPYIWYKDARDRLANARKEYHGLMRDKMVGAPVI